MLEGRGGREGQGAEGRGEEGRGGKGEGGKGEREGRGGEGRGRGQHTLMRAPTCSSHDAQVIKYIALSANPNH